MSGREPMQILRRGAIVASALGPTCTHVQASKRPRPASTSHAPPPAYYEAGGPLPAPISIAGVEARADVVVERILLPPRLMAGLEAIPRATDPIEIVFFRPSSPVRTPRPLVLMSPILGNTNLLVDTFARGFARRGWTGAIVQRKELAFHPEASMEQAEDEVRLVVMRSRQALDWLIARDDIDPARVGTFGISAGSIVSSMLAGADDRLACHLWMLAGGPLSDVMVDTVEERFRGYARAVIARSRKSRDELRMILRDTILTDPIRLATHVDRDKVMLVLARFDRSVPYRYGLALWRALGKPERVVCPFGHYTTFLLLPWLRTRAFQFFARHFDG